MLEICDRATSEQIVAAEKHLADVERDSDFEEDLAVVTGKEISKKSKKIKENKDAKHENENLDIDTESGDDLMMSDHNESDDSNEEYEEDENSSDEESGDGDQIDDDIEDDSVGEVKSKPKSDSKSKKEKVITESELSKVFSDDEISHLSGDEDISGFSDVDDVDEEKEGTNIETKEKPDVWEDIYGRKRDKEGNIIKVTIDY